MENTFSIHCLGMDFAVNFNREWIEKLNDRLITTCTIIEIDNRTKKLAYKHIYAGAAMWNGKDTIDTFVGWRYAYKRAVFFMWMVWTETKQITYAFEPFWQKFRLALGENELYIAERKAHKHG